VFLDSLPPQSVEFDAPAAFRLPVTAAERKAEHVVAVSCPILGHQQRGTRIAPAYVAWVGEATQCTNPDVI
jgi:hypothetical protein